MAKYLNDLSFGHVSDEVFSKEWASSTNFLETLYLDCLPKVETYGVPKVVITPCKEINKSKLEVLLNNPEILNLCKPFDFEVYLKAGKSERKQIALDFLQDGLLAVAKMREWDTEPFKMAYKAVLQKNFVNYHPWSKAVVSKNRQHKAQVWCDYDSDKAEIFVVFSNRGKIKSKMPVTVVEPGDVWIRAVSGKLEWVSENEVKLTSSDGKKSWKIKNK